MYDKEDIYYDDDEVFAMNDNAKVEYSQEACPKLIVKGQCWQRDCKYFHKTAVINQERDRILQQRSEQKEQKKPPTQQAATVNTERGQQKTHNAPMDGWTRNVSPEDAQKQLRRSLIACANTCIDRRRPQYRHLLSSLQRIRTLIFAYAMITER